MNSKTTLFDWYILEANKYFAYFGWGTSSIFSFIGAIEVAHLPWYMYIIAAVFAVGVNVVEAGMGRVSFDELWPPKDINAIITAVFGFICYVYDIFTNVSGFCFMFTGTANIALAWGVDKTTLVWPILLGIMFAIGPEPLYRFYLTHIFAKPVTYKLQPKAQNSYSHPTVNNPPANLSGPSKELIERLQKKYPDQFNAKR